MARKRIRIISYFKSCTPVETYDILAGQRERDAPGGARIPLVPSAGRCG